MFTPWHETNTQLIYQEFFPVFARVQIQARRVFVPKWIPSTIWLTCGKWSLRSIFMYSRECEYRPTPHVFVQKLIPQDVLSCMYRFCAGGTSKTEWVRGNWLTIRWWAKTTPNIIVMLFKFGKWWGVVIEGKHRDAAEMLMLDNLNPPPDELPHVMACAQIFEDATFLLTVASFLLAVELFHLQLTILAFLLTIGAFFAYNFSFFCFQLELFCLQWDSASNKGLKGLQAKKLNCKQKSSNCK